MGPHVVAAVTEIAARQHGAISTTQLRTAGVTAKAQRALVRSGWLRVVDGCVVVLAGSPDTWFRRLHVGLLSLGSRSWVSHEAAAALHGFDRAIAESVEFSLPRAHRGRTRPWPVHTTDELGPHDLITIEGLRCTSATRTIVDLAHARITKARLEAAIDSAVRSGRTAPIVLERRLGELRGPGRWGAGQLDNLLVDAGGESTLERRFLALVRKAGLPRRETQVVQRRDGRHVARVDFLFRDQGIVVEVTGRLGHSTPAERGRDAQRRNELLDLGLKVYEYTWAHVTQRAPWVVATLRQRLASSQTS